MSLSWGELTLLSFLTLQGVNVTETHVEGMMMASYQDFSAPVSAGESTCGGLVDRVLFQPMRCLVIAD